MRVRQGACGNGNWCRAAVILTPLGFTGCSHAPSFNVLGSYFPGWIACLIAGVLAAALAHLLFRRMVWERHLPWLPLFYFSVTILVACSVWLIVFE